MILKTCINCNKKFNFSSFPSHLKEGKGKYCSRKCKWENMVGKKQNHPGAMGRKAWNKGKRGLQPWMNLAGLNKKRGKPPLGNIPWNKGKKCPQLAGENCHLWKGGISFELYSVDWTETLKRSIRERDRYTCQVCGKEPSIHVHHIDYNKKNCNPTNLITLCKRCHSKTNGDRNKWINFFKEDLNE